MNIDVFRRKIVAGAYEFTQHSKDEAGNDNLDTEDIETVILTGKIIQILTKDPRGKRFVVQGLTGDKREV